MGPLTYDFFVQKSVLCNDRTKLRVFEENKFGSWGPVRRPIHLSFCFRSGSVGDNHRHDSDHAECNRVCISNCLSRYWSKMYRVTTFTFQGHVTSSITWQFHLPYDICYSWSIGIEPLSLIVFQIFASKYIWITSIGSWHNDVVGHVTIWYPRCHFL